MSELPTLYRITDDYRQILDWMQDEDADPESFGLLLDEVKGNLEEKSIQVVAVVRSIEALAEQIKQAEQAMAKRRKALENRADHVRDYIRYHLEKAEITVIDSPEFRIQVRKSPPRVEIEEEWNIPSRYMVREFVTKPDKRKIADALKSGENVPGCKLVQGNRLEIR